MRAFVLGVLLLATACRREAEPVVPVGWVAPPVANAPGVAPPHAVGKASYYADSLAGRSTASGEPYAPQMFTAAHLEWPFGTVVDVTRRDTGATARVRINDRGPFAGRDRIIDLSRRAAEQIGMIRAGVVDVELRVISAPRG